MSNSAKTRLHRHQRPAKLQGTQTTILLMFEFLKEKLRRRFSLRLSSGFSRIALRRLQPVLLPKVDSNMPRPVALADTSVFCHLAPLLC